MFTLDQRTRYQAGVVRFYWGDQVVGTGFYVQGKHLLTCAHVIALCFGMQGMIPEQRPETEIEIDFPFIAPGKRLKAKVGLWCPRGADIASVQIQDHIDACIYDQMRPMYFCSDVEDYWDHLFHIAGCLEGLDGRITWSSGVIRGETQANDLIQLQATGERGYPILPGFSGSAVWDEVLGCAVGMTIARDQAREDAGVGFMLPYQRLKPALDAIALFELLLPQAPKLGSIWQDAFNFAKPKYSVGLVQFPEFPETLEAAIMQLLELSENNQAIEQFVAYLLVQNLPNAYGLYDWLRIQRKVTHLEALLEQARREMEARKADTPHLLVWLNKQENTSGYCISAYLVRNPEYCNAQLGQGFDLIQLPKWFDQSLKDKVERGAPIDRSEVEKIVQAYLNQTSRKLGGSKQFRIEIFLPLNDINWEIDRWPVLPTPDPDPDADRIGCMYQVVIRVSDRCKRYTPYLEDWDQRWTMLQNLGGNPAAPHFVCGDQKKRREIRKEIRQQAEVVGLVLTEHAEEFFDPFMAKFETGTPVTLWPRRMIPNLNCHGVFTQLLQGELADLPASVQRLREEGQETWQDSDGQQDHLGRHIGFIWEDYRLIPPGIMD